MVWQVQQLSQALGWLLPIRAEPDQAPTAENSAGQNSAATDQEHTSFGLQILRLNRLAWPEPAAKPTQEPTPQTPPASEPVSAEPVPRENDALDADAADQGQTNPTDSSNEPEEYSQQSVSESKSFEDKSPEDKGIEENDTETGGVNIDLDTAEGDTIEVNINEANFEQLKDDQAVNYEAASDEAINIEEKSRADDRVFTMDDSSEDATSILETDPQVETQPDEDSVDVSGAIEIKENGEESESASLDPEVTQLNSVTGGNSEEHGEQTKSSGGEQCTPDESPKATPRGE
jgi:hypothetical protein